MAGPDAAPPPLKVRSVRARSPPGFDGASDAGTLLTTTCFRGVACWGAGRDVGVTTVCDFGGALTDRVGAGAMVG